MSKNASLRTEQLNEDAASQKKSIISFSTILEFYEGCGELYCYETEIIKYSDGTTEYRYPLGICPPNDLNQDFWGS